MPEILCRASRGLPFAPCRHVGGLHHIPQLRVALDEENCNAHGHMCPRTARDDRGEAVW